MEIPHYVFHCIYKAKCCQIFYAKCINNNYSSEEKELFQDLALDSAKQVMKIKEFYGERFGIDLLSYHFHK